MNLGTLLLRHARCRPDHPAVVFDDQRLARHRLVHRLGETAHVTAHDRLELGEPPRSQCRVSRITVSGGLRHTPGRERATIDTTPGRTPYGLLSCTKDFTVTTPSIVRA